MGKIQRFEDLVAWQKARVLTREVYAATRMGAFARDFGLANQIQRSVESIMSNISEGFERGSTPEFHRFLSTAKSSCAEVRSQLYIAFDVGYVTKERFNQLRIQAEEVGRIIGGLRVAASKPRQNNVKQAPA